MHQIFLRKPWSLLIDRAEHAVVVDVPDNQERSVLCRTMVYSRRFNATSAVMSASASLVVSDWHGELISIEVNGVPLQFTSEGQRGTTVDLDGVLSMHNHLRITLEGSVEDSPRLTGSVSLQMRGPS